MIRKYQVRFWRAAALARESLTLIINAAQVCLTWARGLERASLDAESQSSTDCGSMKQLWAKKR
ncbi:MAG: hypothetical protein VKK42_18175 [Lyngbya sp.]|nr:hypothetical protein [Lyngbya sp.]